MKEKVLALGNGEFYSGFQSGELKFEVWRIYNQILLYEIINGSPVYKGTYKITDIDLFIKEWA